MPQFQVPQFIEKKTKIIGPFTLTQFFFVAGAGGIGVIAFYTLPIFFSILVIILAGGLGLSLALVKINGQPLPRVIMYALTFWQKPKKYVWKRKIKTTTIDTSVMQKIKITRQNMSFQDKIKTAVKNITTGNIPFIKTEEPDTKKERYQTVRHLTGELERAKRVDYNE